MPEAWETVVTDDEDGWERLPSLESPRTVRAREQGISGVEALKSLGHGAGQGATFGFSDEAVGAFGAMTDDGYTKSRDAYRETLKEARDRAPVIYGAGDVGGSLLSGGAAFKAAGSPSTLLGSTIFGAAEGGAGAIGRGDDAEGVAAGLLTGIPSGAALGGVGYGVAETYNRIKRGMNQRTGVRQEQAEDLGLELSPAQKYDDQSLHRIEASMRSDAGYGRAFDDMDARNQRRVNRIAAKTIGIDADKLTEAEMGKASREISKKFKDATQAGDRVDFDDAWMEDLGNLESQYRKVWGKSGASPKIIDDILETTQRGHITPEEYQRRYSQLGKDLDNARTAGDKHKMDLYGGLRDSLDRLVDRNVDGLSDQFKDARKLYKNKILLQRAGVTRTETGNVSPKVLANKLQKDVRGYQEGENTSDLYNAARVSKGVDSGIGDSGTATRSKDLIDHVIAPAKERVGQAYLSGKLGTNMFGGATGRGGAMNPFINSLLQSPAALEAALRELEREGIGED